MSDIEEEEEQEEEPQFSDIEEEEEEGEGENEEEEEEEVETTPISPTSELKIQQGRAAVESLRHVPIVSGTPEPAAAPIVFPGSAPAPAPAVVQPPVAIQPPVAPQTFLPVVSQSFVTPPAPAQPPVPASAFVPQTPAAQAPVVQPSVAQVPVTPFIPPQPPAVQAQPFMSIQPQLAPFIPTGAQTGVGQISSAQTLAVPERPAAAVPADSMDTTEKKLYDTVINVFSTASNDKNANYVYGNIFTNKLIWGSDYDEGFEHNMNAYLAALGI